MKTASATGAARRVRGFSLIEFMVALVLGFVVLAGGSAMYLASSRSSDEAEQFASMSDNGRFALQILNTSLRHTGFFGDATPGDVRQDAALGAVTGDCASPAAAYETASALLAVRATGSTVLSCITDAVPNTDVLVIKSVAPAPLFDADPNDPSAVRDGVISFPAGAWSATQTYIVANGERGVILDGADTPPSVLEGAEVALGVAWPYRLQIFYVRDAAVPTLSRKVLGWAGGAMSIQTEDLVEGVENLRFLFSFDSDNDGEVDTMDNLAAVNAANAWNRVGSIQAYLLVRSSTVYAGYNDQKTYQLGDITITPNDGVRRLLLHSDNTLRNPRLELRGGA